MDGWMDLFIYTHTHTNTQEIALRGYELAIEAFWDDDCGRRMRYGGWRMVDGIKIVTCACALVRFEDRETMFTDGSTLCLANNANLFNNVLSFGKFWSHFNLYFYRNFSAP
ncbi:hypothetical protein ONS95_003489 [Cadophora gregata]|uniref:uncharacterized protein n=1 Tax=Cadophora gregata TaxID=51156 RepID=UPI0026DAD394|nr:uncharacterized protein ONS95_003489 [Cadophora gregata]KAK0108698.1 hypothetical protein ONS95_003489 [Cadophora gregata]KAK0108711.1 hypothetical protein ONS96_002559 [Cadophora gregata f. sp. sojae]